MNLKIFTYNIHKGFNWKNTELNLQHIKLNLELIQPDIVFLQEVVGENKVLEKKFDNWITNQFEFLAKDLWNDSVYSNHAIYDHRHHGNVILSKYPILNHDVHDISLNRYEQRSIMHAEIKVDNETVQAFCTHLNLLHKDRVKQYQKIKHYIYEKSQELNHPIILAGDFNDWNQQASKYLMNIEGIHDAFKMKHLDYAKTFPSFFPFLKLDRIYTKGFKIREAKVLNNKDWRFISDHLPLLIEMSSL
ncbi:MAG: EEP domain-containing protein [Halobacteriovoraceae bacterium]|jgi:endonuclease/exonuclease/phosphatase family metal-dependent hydrolase|nr:EEP domain-containing protein [Halobacteriovoraceae bacterium]